MIRTNQSIACLAGRWLVLGFALQIFPVLAGTTEGEHLIKDSLSAHTVGTKLLTNRLDVFEHGAVGDGKTLNTEAIQAVIDECARLGGGTVVVPKGIFLSGAIFLKPWVNLELRDGAVLKGSTNIEDYPKTVTRIEGHFEPWRAALINGFLELSEACAHCLLTTSFLKPCQPSLSHGSFSAGARSKGRGLFVELAEVALNSPKLHHTNEVSSWLAGVGLISGGDAGGFIPAFSECQPMIMIRQI